MPNLQNKSFASRFEKYRGHSIVHAALFLLFACLNLCAPVSAEDINELLAKMTAAYGSETAKQETKAIRQTGMTYSSLRNMEGRIVRAYQAPDRLRIEINYPDGEEVRILSGPHAWKHDQPMSGPFQGAMMLQAARMALPWNLLKARDQLRDRGEIQQGDGKTLHVLEWPLGTDLKMEVGIEPETGRITRSLGKVKGNMGVMEFGTVYEEFHMQNGRLYAAMEKHFAMGQPTGYTRIEQVDYLEELPESLFAPPMPGLKKPGHVPQHI